MGGMDGRRRTRLVRPQSAGGWLGTWQFPRYGSAQRKKKVTDAAAGTTPTAPRSTPCSGRGFAAGPILAAAYLADESCGASSRK